MNWKRGRVRIITAFANGASGLPAHTWSDVAGYHAGCFGIHEVRPGQCRITHLPSGRALNNGVCPTLKEAKRRVELVAPLCDWEAVTVKNAERVVPKAARDILRGLGTTS